MRDQWNSRAGFLFAAIGAAVGLGNLWRFPFQAYKNGGGAFFLPYFVAIITCAIPLMIMEYTYGRKICGGSIKAFARLKKNLEIIGWVQVMVPLMVMMFYSTIISISVIFMIYCIGHAFGMISWMSNPGPLLGVITGQARHAFDFASGISLYMLGAVIVVWFCNWIIVRRGISGGIEKASKIFTPLLMILMVVFMINSMRLEGASIGLNALFTPDFSKILNPGIWIAAYAQVFFSTTLAVGVMIAYGSYLGEKQDIVNNSFITVLSNSSFDIIAGITVFSTLGFLVNQQGISFDSFGTGAGVAFIAFPIAISTMSSNIVVQGFLGFLFSFCLFIAGISSSISMLESFSTAVLDKFKITRKKLTTIISIVGFVGSGIFATHCGFNFILDLADSYVANYVIATLGLVEVIAISYIYGTEKLREDANQYSDFRIGKWWGYLLKYFTPILLGITVITNFVSGIMKMFGMDSITLISNIVFGWGTVLLMIGVAIVFCKRPWQVDIE